VRRLARPLLYAGIVVIVFGLAKVHARYIADPPYDFTGSFRFGWTIAYCGLLIVGAYGSGLPDLPRSFRQAAASAVLVPLTAAAGISALQLVTGDALLPRFVVFGSAALVVPLSLASVAVARGGRLRAELRDRVLLVAEPDEGVALRDELEREPERPAALLNHLTLPEVHPRGDQLRPLVDLATDIRANLVVVDRAAMADPTVLAQVAALHESGIRIRPLSDFYEEWLGKLPVSELERASLMFDIRELHGVRYLRVKRTIDVAVGLVASVVLALAVPFVLVGNRIANRGPLLYRQDRVGKQGVTFSILKFRTMREAGPDDPATWTQVGDPRVTPFGRLLRATHLDELPQAWNILRGDLAVVGPRPEQPRYVEELVEKLPFYDLRHLVRPGLTGWAQVKYGYAGNERDALEKLQYEFWYLRHQSAWLDLRIIGRTLRSVAGSLAGGR
jgi:lipopolysaccharide/colanic/teichoic acid biosynthesis glycosyltransferase